MKQFIVMMAMIILGMALHGMISGTDEGSMLSSVKRQWTAEIELKTED